MRVLCIAVRESKDCPWNRIEVRTRIWSPWNPSHCFFAFAEKKKTNCELYHLLYGGCFRSERIAYTLVLTYTNLDTFSIFIWIFSNTCLSFIKCSSDPIEHSPVFILLRKIMMAIHVLLWYIFWAFTSQSCCVLVDFQGFIRLFSCLPARQVVICITRLFSFIYV